MSRHDLRMDASQPQHVRDPEDPMHALVARRETVSTVASGILDGLERRLADG